MATALTLKDPCEFDRRRFRIHLQVLEQVFGRGRPRIIGRRCDLPQICNCGRIVWFQRAPVILEFTRLPVFVQRIPGGEAIQRHHRFRIDRMRESLVSEIDRHAKPR